MRQVRQKTKYTKEYVARAVRLCEEDDRPISAVARDLGIRYQTLYDWMTKARKTNQRVDAARPPSSPETRTPEAMQAEIDRLHRELDETKKQLEFAKKAAAFFAQQSK